MRAAAAKRARQAAGLPCPATVPARPACVPGQLQRSRGGKKEQLCFHPRVGSCRGTALLPCARSLHPAGTPALALHNFQHKHRLLMPRAPAHALVCLLMPCAPAHALVRLIMPCAPAHALCACSCAVRPRRPGASSDSEEEGAAAKLAPEKTKKRLRKMMRGTGR